jgi:O-antigen/teichoic acid export membrane protein
MRRILGVLAGQGAASTLLSASFITAGINFLTGILLARALGPEARGMYAVVTMWSNLTAIVLLMGTHVRLARETPKALEDELGVARFAYIRGLAAVGLLMLPAAILYGAVVLLNEDVFGQNLPLTIWIIGFFNVPFAAWAAMQAQVELGRGNFGHFAALQVSFSILQFTLVGALWLLGSEEASVYAWAFFLSSVGTTTLVQFLIRKSYPQTRGANAVTTVSPSYGIADKLQAGARLIASSRRDGLAVVVTTVSMSVDRILVAFLFPLEIVGVYVLAQSLAQLQNIVIESLSPIFFSRLAGKSTVIEAEIESIGQGLRKMVVLAVMVSCLSIMVLPWIIPLVYGDAFLESSKLVIFLVPALAVRGLMRPFEEVLKAVNKALDQSYVLAFWSVTVVIAGAIAVASDDIMLIPLTMLGVGLVSVLLSSFLVARHFGRPLADVLVPRAADVKSLVSDIRLRLRQSGAAA